MAPQGDSWGRRIQAAESAGRLLDELSIDQSKQINVFGMCEDLGLWLVFLPMDNLLGAYVPEGAGGVLVTTQRPIPIQRYTAAHEIGHWRLDHGHGVALDGEEHVLGATSLEREQLAQVFAGQLLMPPPLVYGVLERLGLSGQSLQAEHAYAVAREAGVSYEAAIRQLTHLEVISGAQATALRRQSPLRVKADLALGRRPVNGYADVWPVDERWDDHVLALRAEDEVVISLPENRSTGYRWMLPDERRPVAPSPAPPLTLTNPRSIDQSAVSAMRTRLTNQEAAPRTRTAPAAVLERLRAVPASPSRPRPAVANAELVGDEYLPARAPWQPPRRVRRDRLAPAPATPSGSAPDAPTDPVIAGTGRRVLGVRFPRPGPATIRLRYQSPYNNDPAIEEYVLHTLVEPRRAGFSADQLASDADEPWVADVRQRNLGRTLDPLDDDEQLDDDADETN